MSPLMRTILAFLAAVLITYTLASFFHSQQVLSGLQSLGIEISPTLRLSYILGDMRGLAGLFPSVIAIALAIGFIIGFFVKKILTPLAPFAYPIAGTCAMATTLAVMSAAMDITPIAGARGTLGFSLQCLAGACGGLAFSFLRPKPATLS